MLTEIVCEKIVKKIYKVALDSVNSTCIYWHHQPQIPDALIKIKEKEQLESKWCSITIKYTKYLIGFLEYEVSPIKEYSHVILNYQIDDE